MTMAYRLFIDLWWAKLSAILISIFSFDARLVVFTTLVILAEFVLNMWMDITATKKLRRDALMERIYELVSYMGLIFFTAGMANVHPWFEGWFGLAGFAIVLITAGKGLFENFPLARELWNTLAALKQAQATEVFKTIDRGGSK